MVYILLAPGFEELEALAPADILRRGGVEVTLAAVGALSVTGGHGITVEVDDLAERISLRAGDMLVLPGGLGGMRAIEASDTAMALVRQAAAEEDIWLSALCASPTILGRAGLLHGKRAVCYPGMEGELAGAEPHMDCHVVTDGKLITGRAAGAAVETGLALLAALAGQERADAVRREMHV